ncbi:MAG: ferric reductase-like transmembrane domain-containing protein [Spirochaetota bacterium]
MKKVVLGVLALGLLAVPIVAWAQIASLVPNVAVVAQQLAWLFGVLGFVILFFQFVLSSRVRFLEADVGLDRMIHLHRLTGVVGLSLVVLHFAAVAVFELIEFGYLNLTLLKFSGTLGLLVILLVAFAALFYKRIGWRYETWKRIHLAGYLVFPIVFIHSYYLSNRIVTSRPYVDVYWWVLLGIYVAIVLYKIGLAISVRRRPYTVSSAVAANHDVTTVTFEGPGLKHKPGQFMLVSVQVGGRLEPSHPYTIASSPEAPNLQISAKAVGDFSSALRTVKRGSRAYIEGPYGVFSFLEHDAPSLVFVAGGIGITPFMSQLRHIRDAGMDRKVRLIWGNKTEADICFGDELEAMKSRLTDFDLVHVMSNQDDWPGEKGFITREIIERYVDDIDTATFFVCGPPIMMDKVIPMLGALGVPSPRVRYERFSLG